MGNRHSKYNRHNMILLVMTAMSICIAVVTIAYGHGGKHAGQFTHLQALQKGTGLYDKLIDKGKLDETWESGLANVAISMRKVDSGEEIVVAFKRESGDPGTVYIFFKTDGKYAGSNFTGETKQRSRSHRYSQSG